MILIINSIVIRFYRELYTEQRADELKKINNHAAVYAAEWLLIQG